MRNTEGDVKCHRNQCNTLERCETVKERIRSFHLTVILNKTILLSSVIPRHRLFFFRVHMELSQNGIAFLDDQETVTAPTPTISTSHPFMKYLRSLHFYINHFTWKEDCVIVIAISRPNSIFLRIPNVKSRFLITTTRHPNHILVSNLAESSKELIERKGP